MTQKLASRGVENSLDNIDRAERLALSRVRNHLTYRILSM